MMTLNARWLLLSLLLPIGCSATIEKQGAGGVVRSSATTQPEVSEVPSAEANLAGTETIVFLRHGEKPRHGLGQITPQGLNRAIALSTMLPEKFGKPDFIFAPDPSQKVEHEDGSQFYVRPLATIEPTAIALGMPVQTPFGYRQIDQLNEELTKPKYANALIFVAWEHGREAEAAANLVEMFGGNRSDVPPWPGDDYDSLYVVKIMRVLDKPPTVTFTHEHEGLDGESKEMPAPAGRN
jgi:hypothetical protein